MRDLSHKIKDIQRHVGAEDDGIFGPETARAVMRALNECVTDFSGGHGLTDDDEPMFDPRTLETLHTLDPKALPVFMRFAKLAVATAASMGVDYRGISGHRSWDEQNELYNQGRTAPGLRVTNARGGYSWHNFGVAMDFGVFRGRRYLDNDEPDLARRVHVACAAHAESCGLTWGGSWKTFKDIPHYQLGGLPSSPNQAAREEYEINGTIL